MKERQKPWWTAVIGSAGAFVFASLAWVAAGFGDRESPVNQLLNERGGTIVGALAGLTVTCGLLAMFFDQRDRSGVDSDRSEAPNGADDGL